MWSSLNFLAHQLNKIGEFRGFVRSMPKGETFSCLQYVSALAFFHLLHENRQIIDISCVLFPEARSSFKVPGYRPSDFDKKLLIWTGRFKRKEDIPEQVS